MSLRRPFAAQWRSGLALCALLVAFISAPTHAQLPTAQSVAGQIRTGWNLGNTLEAQCGETAWGNPATTQSLINAVKAAGFNAIRIPAGWNCHVNPAGSTTIDSAWMARVKTVVDYAYNQNMYVILNIHWDGGWLQDNPTFAFQTANNTKQRAFWTQIANTFAAYNERLMFAGTNEVHADYNTPTSEHLTVQQSYNQTFVSAVRATGGNNASRTLVVQTYNTNAWHGLNFFTMPTDTIANRLIVEFHHYDPYDYTINPNGPCFAWGAQFTQYSQCSWAQEAYHTDLFAQIRNKWVAAGIPVIMGEYGVARRSSANDAARQYYLEYVNRTATTNGIKTFYWDNGAQSGASDVFALFDRNSGAVVDANGLNAIMRGVGGSNSTFALAVTKGGAGTGTVTSSPSGINCGSTCNTCYNSGTSVTLTAAAAGGSTFGGWSGACSGTATACTVSMTAARNVTATFNSSNASFTLSVTRAGTGTGTVTSNPSGINCGASCTANYASGASVTSTAAGASGSTFAGWGGSCSGTGSCVLSMTASRSVTATFNTGGGTGGTCANPVTFTSQSGNFNTTGAVCYRTNQNIAGWGCSNFDGRTLTVGGVARTCGQLPLTRATDGYYYFAVTAGNFPWASLYAW